ncbi:MAG: Wadjet anti-phage system protein JetD domain-containing protein, partial [Bacteroidota bacterium]
LLAELLNICLPKAAIQAKETQFERRFGLKFDEPLLRIRFLDEAITTSLPKDIALPISHWQQQNIAAEYVLLITDPLNFLRFPKQPKSLAVLATDEVLDDLFRLPFLHQAKLYFWGDISVAAFQHLSDLRQHFPKLRSFLMHKAILEKYTDLAETEKKKVATEDLLLQADERSCLQTLQQKEGTRKLWQRHIWQEDLLREMRRLD